MLPAEGNREAQRLESNDSLLEVINAQYHMVQSQGQTFHKKPRRATESPNTFEPHRVINFPSTAGKDGSSDATASSAPSLEANRTTDCRHKRIGRSPPTGVVDELQISLKFKPRRQGHFVEDFIGRLGIIGERRIEIIAKADA